MILTKEMEVDIVVLDMPVLDTRRRDDLIGNVIADIVLQLLGFCAEKEYSAIHIRQAEGIAAAKLRGAKFGRPRCDVPGNFEELVRLHQAGLISVQVAQKANISAATFYRRRRAMLG